MIKPVVAVYTSNHLAKAIALVYYNGEWHETVVKVRDENNAWKVVGGQGVLLLPLIDADGEYVYDSDEKLIYVRGE